MDIAIAILLAVAIFSAMCSFLTLRILYLLNKWNSYVNIITCLTVAQMGYELSILMVPLPHSITTAAFYISIRSVCGLTVTFITNLISITVLYTVKYMKAINLAKHEKTIAVIIMVPSLIIGITVGVTVHLENFVFFISSTIYYWTRIGSILFNIVAYITISYEINQRFSQKGDLDPVNVLATRMKYYPVAQVISRLGVAWYEAVYGHGYYYSNDMSLQEKTALFLYVSTLPLAGVGYFLIFIHISPGAMACWRGDLASCFKYNYLTPMAVKSNANAFADTAALTSKILPTTDSDTYSEEMNYSQLDEDMLDYHISRLYSEGSASRRTQVNFRSSFERTDSHVTRSVDMSEKS